MIGEDLLDASSAIEVPSGKLDLGALQDEGDDFHLHANVAGEPCFGAEKSGRPEANRAAIQALGAHSALIEPRFDPLRSDPRSRTLLARTNLPLTGAER